MGAIGAGIAARR